jgi:hypothetical protein
LEVAEFLMMYSSNTNALRAANLFIDGKTDLVTIGVVAQEHNGIFSA